MKVGRKGESWETDCLHSLHGAGDCGQNGAGGRTVLHAACGANALVTARCTGRAAAQPRQLNGQQCAVTPARRLLDAGITTPRGNCRRNRALTSCRCRLSWLLRLMILCRCQCRGRSLTLNWLATL